MNKLHLTSCGPHMLSYTMYELYAAELSGIRHETRSGWASEQNFDRQGESGDRSEVLTKIGAGRELKKNSVMLTSHQNRQEGETGKQIAKWVCRKLEMNVRGLDVRKYRSNHM